MRKKNAKRLWPVPATLAVMAVAALLAFGLMATTGAQPAAAQSSADCDVAVDIAANDVVTPTVDNKFASDPEDCQAKGDTATVKFTGPATRTAGVDDPGKLDLLIQDDNGPIRAYLNNYVDYDTSGNEYQITGTGASAGLGTANEEAPASMRFRIHELEVPLAARDTQGQYAAQSVTISVSGNVYIYPSGAALTNVIAGVPTDSTDKRNEITATANDVVIVFLGAPALGKDSDNDINKIIDDVEQCQLIADTTMKMEQPADGNCPSNYENDMSDIAESKSKLVAIGGESPTAVIDGMSKDHKLTTQTSATIYAVVEDAKGQALPGAEVNFNATIEPSGLELDFDTDRDVDAKMVIISGTATSSQVFFAGTLPAGIMAGDAIASREITGLPTGDAPYRITVNVTAGSLDLGSVVVTRVGKPTSLKAGVST